MGEDSHEEFLGFEEFRSRVGYSSQKVRAALMGLRLSPQTRPGDMRRLFYLGSWIPQVQDFLAESGANRTQN